MKKRKDKAERCAGLVCLELGPFHIQNDNYLYVDMRTLCRHTKLLCLQYVNMTTVHVKNPCKLLIVLPHRTVIGLVLEATGKVSEARVMFAEAAAVRNTVLTFDHQGGRAWCQVGRARACGAA